MEKKTSSVPSDAAVFRELIQNDAQFSIVIALYYYKSLKLKHIAKFIGKTNPTTLHHIKNLAEQDLIELDQERIVGKYYKLSEFGNHMMANMYIGGDETDSPVPETMDNQEEVDILSNAMDTMAIAVKNIISHTAYYLKSAYFQEKKNKQKSDFTTQISIDDLNIKNKSQMDKLVNLLKDFNRGLTKLKEETENIDEGELAAEYMIFYMAVPLTIMHPEKIDKALKEAN